MSTSKHDGHHRSQANADQKVCGTDRADTLLHSARIVFHHRLQSHYGSATEWRIATIEQSVHSGLLGETLCTCSSLDSDDHLRVPWCQPVRAGNKAELAAALAREPIAWFTGLPPTVHIRTFGGGYPATHADSQLGIYMASMATSTYSRIASVLIDSFLRQCHIAKVVTSRAISSMY